jgi:hypothetical protein
VVEREIEPGSGQNKDIRLVFVALTGWLETEYCVRVATQKSEKLI